MTKVKTFNSYREECFESWESAYNEVNDKINTYAKDHNLIIKNVCYDRTDMDVIANVLFEGIEMEPSSFCW